MYEVLEKPWQPDWRFGNISMDSDISGLEPPHHMQQVKRQNDCKCKFHQIMIDLVENNRAGNVGKKY